MFIGKIEVNLLWTILSILCTLITFFGYLVNYWETFVPGIVNDAFRYGKTSRRFNQWIGIIEVPKSWFTHFYVFGAVWIGIWWIAAFNVYFLGGQAPNFLLEVRYESLSYKKVSNPYKISS